MSDNNSSVKKILLVEDDRQLSDLVAEFLESEGYHVKQEYRGDTVEKRVDKFVPDLIILDIMLPGKDGFAVCKDLRPGFKGPILMLTAKGTDFDQVPIISNLTETVKGNIPIFYTSGEFKNIYFKFSP